ncbi:DEAD/DEAH box helicase, partial [Lactobacillus sp. XV13L]|nr:DEAD/DEAH box helicase [Lactobacillus sp. XV13L]
MNNIFNDDRIRPEIRAGLGKISFTEPTKVQAKVIPVLLAHQNAVVQAVTGSGKTHAFLIPVLNDVDEKLAYPQAILTAPSRELAEQLYQVARQLRDLAGLDINIAHLACGSDPERQLKK